jgi:hypothetical protein
MMIETQTRKANKMQTAFAPVHAGHYIFATRKDGRDFVGYIQSVKALAKGTFVVVRIADDVDGPVYKSFYLEGLDSWATDADYSVLAHDYNL